MMVAEEGIIFPAEGARRMLRKSQALLKEKYCNRTDLWRDQNFKGTEGANSFKRVKLSGKRTGVRIEILSGVLLVFSRRSNHKMVGLFVFL